MLSRTTTQITITWTSDQFVQSWLEWGLTTSYGNETVHETSFNYQTHIMTISGLTAGTTYHVRAHIVNQEALETVGSDASFQTDSVPDPPPSGGYPPTVAALSYVATPTGVSMPSTSAWTTDPTFTSVRIRRLAGANVRHEYAKIAAFNCDGSLIHLWYGDTYIRTSDWTATSYHFSVSNSWWSNTDPDLLFYLNDGNPAQLRSYRLSTNTDSLIRTFSGYGTVWGWWENAVSYDDRYFAFSTSQPGVIRYDRQTDTVQNRTFAAIGSVPNSVPNNLQVSPSGLVVCNWESSGGVWSLDANLNVIRRMSVRGAHGDSGKDANGNDIWVQTCNVHPVTGSAEYGIYAFRLDSAVNTQLLTNNAKTTFAQSGHVSARNIALPGWACLSSHYSPTSNLPGQGQVVMVKTDGSGECRVYGHTHARGPDPTDFPYLNNIMACVSPDGKRIVWVSDWLDANTMTRSTPYCFVSEAIP